MGSTEEVITRLSNKIEKRKSEILGIFGGVDSLLLDAMRYSFINSQAKNTRSLLFCLLSSLFEPEDNILFDVAIFLELIHCYSLIHDDLPALDNDDYRRGKKSLHRAFSESTAILAGDGLLIMAFEVLSSIKTIEASRVVAIMSRATSRIGVRGMIYGQFEDLNLPDESLITPEFIEGVHRNKSALMFGLAGETVAIINSLNDDGTRILNSLGLDFGMITQLADDIVDVGKKENVNMAQKIGVEPTRALLDSHIASFASGVDGLKLKYEFPKERAIYLDCLKLLVGRVMKKGALTSLG